MAWKASAALADRSDEGVAANWAAGCTPRASCIAACRPLLPMSASAAGTEGATRCWSAGGEAGRRRGLPSGVSHARRASSRSLEPAMPLCRLERLAAMLLAVLQAAMLLAAFKCDMQLLPDQRGRERLLLPPAVLRVSAAPPAAAFEASLRHLGLSRECPTGLTAYNCDCEPCEQEIAQEKNVNERCSWPSQATTKWVRLREQSNRVATHCCILCLTGCSLGRLSIRWHVLAD